MVDLLCVILTAALGLHSKSHWNPVCETSESTSFNTNAVVQKKNPPKQKHCVTKQHGQANITPETIILSK